MVTKNIALALLIPFSILTAYAVWEVGYLGILDYHRHSPAGWQVFMDLVVACLLLIFWMLNDAKKAGRNPWPFVGITLFFGSFGPLMYVLFNKTRSEK